MCVKIVLRESENNGKLERADITSGTRRAAWRTRSTSIIPINGPLAASWALLPTWCTSATPCSPRTKKMADIWNEALSGWCGLQWKRRAATGTWTARTEWAGASGSPNRIRLFAMAANFTFVIREELLEPVPFSLSCPPPPARNDLSTVSLSPWLSIYRMSTSTALPWR